MRAITQALASTIGSIEVHEVLMVSEQGGNNSNSYLTDVLNY